MRGHIRVVDEDKQGKPLPRSDWRYIAIVDTGTTPDGKRGRKWKTFTTKRDADRYLAETIATVNKGDYVEPLTQTVAQYMDEWLKAVSSSLKPTTAASYSATVKDYIKPNIGHLKVKAVDAAVLGDLYTKLRATGGRTNQGLSARTVRYVPRS